MSSRHLPAPAKAGVAGIHRKAGAGASLWLDAGNKSRHDRRVRSRSDPGTVLPGLYRSLSLPAVASKTSPILDVPVGAPGGSPAVASVAGSIADITIGAPGVFPAGGPAVNSVTGSIAGITIAASGVYPAVGLTVASITRPIVGIAVAAALCFSRCDRGRCARSRNTQACQEQSSACNTPRRYVSLSKRQRLALPRIGLRIVSHLLLLAPRQMVVVLQTNLVPQRQTACSACAYLQGNGGEATVALSSCP